MFISNEVYMGYASLISHIFHLRNQKSLTTNSEGGHILICISKRTQLGHVNVYPILVKDKRVYKI